MSPLLLVVIGAFAWKLQQLIRRPRDRALQVVVGSLALVLAGDVAALTPAARGLPPGVGTLIQNVGLILSLYLLLCFFVYASREHDGEPARGPVHRVGWELVPALLVLVGMTASWLVTPAPARDMDYDAHGLGASTAAFYLIAYVYIGYNNLVCIYHAWWMSRHASRHPAVGLRAAAAGLGLGFVGAPIGGTIKIVALLTGHPLPTAITSVQGPLILVGLLLYLVGICWPGLINRGRWVRRTAALWNKHRRLEPLRRLLRPTLDQARRLPSGERRTRRWTHPSAAKWVECRDGLVTASAWVPADEPVRASLREQVVQLRAAVDACIAGRQAGVTRQLWALPAADGFDADLDSLVLLSDAVRGRFR